MDGADATAPPAAPGRRKRSRLGRLLRWVLPSLLLLVVLLGALFAVQGLSAYRHLKAAQTEIPELRAQIVAGEAEAARASVQSLQEDTAAARDAMHGPHWALLAAVPGVGPNIDAVQRITEALNLVATDGLSEVVDVLETVDVKKLGPVDGRVRLAPIKEAAPAVVAADQAVTSAAGAVGEIQTEKLLAPLRGPVTDLQDRLEELASATDTAGKAVRLIPPMLGADGPRHYLLLVQNNAEPRALGGLPGAAILLRADHGAIELAKQSPAIPFPEPVLPLTTAERSLYGKQLGTYLGNVTATPDFPRAAQLAREMWSRATGRKVDGVIAIDPVALQLMLGATGPVTLPNGQQLTGQNTAQILLNQVYKDIPDPKTEDAFFVRAASAIFEKLTSSGGDVWATADALGQAARHGRLLVWSAHDDEESALRGTRVAGALRGKRDGSPVLGVYLHDRTAAKIAYYEDMDVRVTASQCRPDGSRKLHVEVTVSSDVPRGVRRFPDQLTGGGSHVPVGVIKSDVFVYAPAHGLITDFRTSRGDDQATIQFHDGLHVAKQTLTLRPGKSVTLEFDINSRADLPGDLLIRTTPGPAPGKFSAATFGCP